MADGDIFKLVEQTTGTCHRMLFGLVSMATGMVLIEHKCKLVEDFIIRLITLSGPIDFWA